MEREWPELWRDLPIAVVDVETTGLDAATDRIIEIGIVRFERGEEVEVYGELIDPGCPIPPEVTKITGIRPEDVAGKPSFAELARPIHERLQGVGIVAYNLSFDRGFVTNELERVGLSWPSEAPTLDPLIFARQFYKNQPRKNLGAIAALMGIPLEEAHRATHDARVAGLVLFEFADRLPARLEDLVVLQGQWEAAQAAEMAHWRGGAGFSLGSSSAASRKAGLGPAYIYGDEADPLRALYASVAEAPERVG